MGFVLCYHRHTLQNIIPGILCAPPHAALFSPGLFPPDKVFLVQDPILYLKSVFWGILSLMLLFFQEPQSPIFPSLTILYAE